MRNGRGFLLTLLACSASAGALAGSATNESTLPPSGEPARIDNPPCGNGDGNSASLLLDALGTAVDTYIGLPITTTALANRGVSNRVLVMLGLHNGQSACQTLCVGVPANVEVTPIACMADNWSNGWKCQSGLGHNAVGWARIENFSLSTLGNRGGVYCVDTKNWSHDRARRVSLEVSW